MEKAFSEKIMKNLSLSTKVTPKDINSIVMNRKFDVLLYVVDTDYDSVSEVSSKYFFRVCDRFKNLGLKNIVMASYDLNINGLFNFENVMQ